MDLILNYLAMLSDEERDRVIEAQEWREGSMGYAGGARCMIGHAEAPESGLSSAPKACAHQMAHPGRGRGWNVGDDFDRLCLTVGLPVAVARIKAECARLNDRIPAAAPARETVGAA